MIRRTTYLVLALILVLVALPMDSFAANNTPDTAISLTAQYAGETNRLVGDSGGAVIFYRIDYAGNGQPVPIYLTAQPGDNVTGRGFGFKIYGPNGLLGEAVVEHREDTWIRYAMTLASSTAGVYLVQVYNFTNQIAVDYNIQAYGLESATVTGGSAPTGVTNTEPDAAVPVTADAQVSGGAITGAEDGAQQYFTIAYPGGGDELKIDMVYSPPRPFGNKAVGFNLWDTSKTVDERNEPAMRGVEVSRDGEKATISATYSADEGTAFQLQVFNYEPGFTITYTLLVTGSGGIVTQATGNLVPERAYELPVPTAAMRGTLTASGDGALNYYLVNYPGSNRRIRITVTGNAVSGLTEDTFGFNIYEGADLHAKVKSKASDDGTKRSASYTIEEDSAFTYGIQVWNFSQNGPVDYMIFLTEPDN